MKKKYINKEISWLSFNARVLQEAANPDVPLIERIKFLGICSSNLDEFYRVRVATLKRLVHLGKKAKKLIGDDPQEILQQITEITREQHKNFDRIFTQIISDLRRHHIFLIDETQLNDKQGKFVLQYFTEKVRPQLFPIMLDQASDFPELKDRMIYFAVHLSHSKNDIPSTFALVEIPSETLPRFLILPQEGKNRYIMFLDDVIRFGLPQIFKMFACDTFAAYTIKITRDAELDIDDDISQSYLDKINKSLKKRKAGNPVRLIYDSRLPDSIQSELFKKLKLHKSDTTIAGSKYHNNRDLVSFPDMGMESLRYERTEPLQHPAFSGEQSMFRAMREQDILLHFPYQSFHAVIDLLREASIDPAVESINFTVYRVARDSSVMNALINAVQNGKEVTVVLELQARFDEEANIFWANKLQDAGVKIIFGVPGLKVHSKLCLISRREKNKTVRYAIIGTGNFNERTAKIYSDHSLFTSDKKLTRDVIKIFDFLKNNYKSHTYKSLIVSPQFMRKEMTRLIKKEIKFAAAGKPAWITLKLNNLVDNQMGDLLYRASQSGVKIRLLVRGMISLIPGVKELSENIEAISIVDKFLEHSRIFVFGNGGDPLYFLSSADWMTRNLDRRVEVTCPVYAPEIKQELQDFLDIQWRDNVRARILDEKQNNNFRNDRREKIRAQWRIYAYLKNKSPS